MADNIASAATLGHESRELQARLVDLLLDLVRREPLVAVGDTVLFSWQAGHEIRLEDDDERYLLMREEDVLAVVNLESACS